MSENRVCPVCSALFTPSAPKQIYCSERCNAREQARAKRQRTKEADEAELQEWARQNLGLRYSGDKPAGGVPVGACGSRICEAGCRREGGAKCQM